MTTKDADGREWVLVPREATAQMVVAMVNAPISGHPETGSPTVIDMWAEAIAAAPQFVPPVVTDQTAQLVAEKWADYQTSEVLRRVHRWCLTAYDAGVAVGVRRWIEGGMIGKLPPMPKWILECYPEERAIDAALAKAGVG